MPTMTTTRSELIALIYRFYPRGMMHIHRIHVGPDEIYYGDMEEHQRLIAAAKRGKDEYPIWKAMTRRLGDQYGLQNECTFLLADWVAPAYSARIWLTNEIALSFHVSLIGPYYGIRLPGLPEDVTVAREVAREIEATYPGYQQIPPELGNEVISDVDAGPEYGRATIYDCLFSDAWTRLAMENRYQP